MNKIKQILKRVGSVFLATVTILTSLNLSGIGMVNTYAFERTVEGIITPANNIVYTYINSSGLVGMYAAGSKNDGSNSSVEQIYISGFPQGYVYNSNKTSAQEKATSVTFYHTPIKVGDNTIFNGDFSVSSTDSDATIKKVIEFQNSDGTKAYRINSGADGVITNGGTYWIRLIATENMKSKSGETHTYKSFSFKITQGSVHTHSGGTATCTAKAVCSTCGAEYGEALGHSPNVTEATCTLDKYCTRCNTVFQSKLGHSYNVSTPTCTVDKKCTRCGYVADKAKGHSYASSGDEKLFTAKSSGALTDDDLVTYATARANNTSVIYRVCKTCKYIDSATPYYLTTIDSNPSGNITYESTKPYIHNNEEAKAILSVEDGYEITSKDKENWTAENATVTDFTNPKYKQGYLTGADILYKGGTTNAKLTGNVATISPVTLVEMRKNAAGSKWVQDTTTINNADNNAKNNQNAESLEGNTVGISVVEGNGFMLRPSTLSPISKHATYQWYYDDFFTTKYVATEKDATTYGVTAGTSFDIEWDSDDESEYVNFGGTHVGITDLIPSQTAYLDEMKKYSSEWDKDANWTKVSDDYEGNKDMASLYNDAILRTADQSGTNRRVYKLVVTSNGKTRTSSNYGILQVISKKIKGISATYTPLRVNYDDNAEISLDNLTLLLQYNNDSHVMVNDAAGSVTLTYNGVDYNNTALKVSDLVKRGDGKDALKPYAITVTYDPKDEDGNSILKQSYTCNTNVIIVDTIKPEFSKAGMVWIDKDENEIEITDENFPTSDTTLKLKYTPVAKDNYYTESELTYEWSGISPQADGKSIIIDSTTNTKGIKLKATDGSGNSKETGTNGLNELFGDEIPWDEEAPVLAKSYISYVPNEDVKWSNVRTITVTPSKAMGVATKGYIFAPTCYQTSQIKNNAISRSIFYGIGGTDDDPKYNWSTRNYFTATRSGYYYIMVRDKAGNISEPMEIYVASDSADYDSKNKANNPAYVVKPIDSQPPVISLSETMREESAAGYTQSFKCKFNLADVGGSGVKTLVYIGEGGYEREYDVNNQSTYTIYIRPDVNPDGTPSGRNEDTNGRTFKLIDAAGNETSIVEYILTNVVTKEEIEKAFKLDGAVWQTPTTPVNRKTGVKLGLSLGGLNEKSRSEITKVKWSNENGFVSSSEFKTINGKEFSTETTVYANTEYYCEIYGKDAKENDEVLYTQKYAINNIDPTEPTVTAAKTLVSENGIQKINIEITADDHCEKSDCSSGVKTVTIGGGEFKTPKSIDLTKETVDKMDIWKGNIDVNINGTYTLTATDEVGNIQKETVNISDLPVINPGDIDPKPSPENEKFNINIESAEHGVAYAVPDKAAKGSEVCLVYKADDGYTIKDWHTEDGITITNDSFIMPGQNITITPEFMEDTLDFNAKHSVEVVSNPEDNSLGTVGVAFDNEFSLGQDVYLTYTVKDATVRFVGWNVLEGAGVNIENNHFKMIDGNVKIEGKFKEISTEKHGVTINSAKLSDGTTDAGTGCEGYICSDTTSFSDGDTVYLGYKVADNYKFKEWRVDAGSVTIDDNNSFVMSDLDVELTPIFEECDTNDGPSDDDYGPFNPNKPDEIKNPFTQPGLINQNNVNIDLNGDGIPDVNVDTDGNGKADTNLDLDGDGKPDHNLYGTTFNNGDGVDLSKLIKVVVDKDENNKPDFDSIADDKKAEIDGGVLYEYIGTPEAGDEDKFVYYVYPVYKGDEQTNEDAYKNPTNWKKEFIYLDTNNDGVVDNNDDAKEIIVNQDTDNDQWPDTNIDMDGDGIPDTNLDLDGDGHPDVNVDTDEDGVPDINIDTDNNWKPDTNLDIDGKKGADGKYTPDVNKADADGDGKYPDWDDKDQHNNPTNRDVDEDGLPDLNVDTDNDQWPDENIDVDGDGIPDVNVKYYNITLDVTPADSGYAFINGPSNAYYGTDIKLISIPVSGYKFDKWSSSDVTVTNNTFAMISKDVAITAEFVTDSDPVVPADENYYEVTVTSDATKGVGTVIGATKYKAGETVNLQHLALEGYKYKEWTTEDGFDITNQAFVMPAKNVTVTAVFEEDASNTGKHKVTVIFDESEGFAGTMHGQIFNTGDTVKLVRYAKNGYAPDKWAIEGDNADGVEIKNSVFTMPAHDITIKSTFVKTSLIEVKTLENGYTTGNIHINVTIPDFWQNQIDEYKWNDEYGYSENGWSKSPNTVVTKNGVYTLRIKLVDGTEYDTVPVTVNKIDRGIDKFHTAVMANYVSVSAKDEKAGIDTLKFYKVDKDTNSAVDITSDIKPTLVIQSDADDAINATHEWAIVTPDLGSYKAVVYDKLGNFEEAECIVDTLSAGGNGGFTAYFDMTSLAVVNGYSRGPVPLKVNLSEIAYKTFPEMIWLEEGKTPDESTVWEMAREALVVEADETYRTYVHNIEENGTYCLWTKNTQGVVSAKPAVTYTVNIIDNDAPALQWARVDDTITIVSNDVKAGIGQVLLIKKVEGAGEDDIVYDITSSDTNPFVSISKTTDGSYRGTYSIDKAGKYELKVVDKLGNAFSDTISVQTRIFGITEPKAVTGLSNGTPLNATALGLPSTVKATTNSETLKELPVTWNIGSFAYNTEYNPGASYKQTFILTGKVNPPANVIMSSNKKTVLISVQVNAAGVATRSGLVQRYSLATNNDISADTLAELKETVEASSLVSISEAIKETKNGNTADAGAEVYVINNDYATINLDKNVGYTGKAVEPEVSVTYTSNGVKQTLIENEDYKVSYDDNVAIGEATVTVTGMGDYSGSASKTFEITEDGINLSINKTSVVLDENSSLELSVEGNKGRDVEWLTSDADVITVENGIITSHGTGKATVSAKCGSSTVTCNVTVKALKAKTVKVRKQLKLTSSGVSSLLDIFNVKWTSSDKSIATVSKNLKGQGIVKGKKAGTVIITATLDGKTIGTYKVVVTK